MRRTALFVVLGLACLATLAHLGAAAQQPAPPSGTLELVQRDRETRFTMVDLPPRQGNRRLPTPGDVAVISGPMRSASNRRVGRVQAHFTAVSRGRRFAAEVTGTFLLRRGNIMIQGPIGEGRVDRLAIVGGTGVYAGARGTLTIRDGRRDSRFHFTFMP